MLIILSQYLWVSNINLMRNLASRKKQAALHPLSYSRNALGLCVRHVLTYLNYYFIDESFSLRRKVYLKTF